MKAWSLRYLLIWLALAVAAIGNGILRESTYGTGLPELVAHQLSTVTGILFTGVVAFLLCRRRPPRSAGQAWAIGVFWLLLTLVFEFGFGHYVAGHSWERLLADYNILAGRVWPVFLIWVLLLPVLIFRYTHHAATKT
ncbi:hypothetical protein [Pseudohalioglobus sediminis]|uniref:hypothetical protein n=1 Tax=Pseudohalioglobus sediminis TaxID=2606449 RepID=UPI001CB6E7DA|nr:hypothetical protein [Pseudohalioglobus sediminis]